MRRTVGREGPVVPRVPPPFFQKFCSNFVHLILVRYLKWCKGAIIKQIISSVSFQRELAELDKLREDYVISKADEPESREGDMLGED